VITVWFTTNVEAAVRAPVLILTQSVQITDVLTAAIALMAM